MGFLCWTDESHNIEGVSTSLLLQIQRKTSFSVAHLASDFSISARERCMVFYGTPTGLSPNSFAALAALPSYYLFHFLSRTFFIFLFLTNPTIPKTKNPKISLRATFSPISYLISRPLKISPPSAISILHGGTQAFFEAHRAIANCKN